MQKKPEDKVAMKAADKAAEVKAAVKTTTEKAAVKKEEVKEAVKAAAEKVEKKAEAVKTEAVKAEAKVEAKVEEKKAAKAETKKPAKKAEKTVMVPEIYIQFQNREDVVADVIERAKEAYVADGHRLSSIKTLQVYLKPEESAAYYVINMKYAGKVALF